MVGFREYFNEYKVIYKTLLVDSDAGGRVGIRRWWTRRADAGGRVAGIVIWVDIK